MALRRKSPESSVLYGATLERHEGIVVSPWPKTGIWWCHHGPHGGIVGVFVGELSRGHDTEPPTCCPDQELTVRESRVFSASTTTCLLLEGQLKTDLWQRAARYSPGSRGAELASTRRPDTYRVKDVKLKWQEKIIPETRNQWLSSLLSMTQTPELASSLLDDRLRFTTLVAQQLTHEMKNEQQVVYGVWLVGHSHPVYIGQTTDAHRRLWDLPIGESHHLSNSFPPEIWGRVIVVRWGAILMKNEMKYRSIFRHIEEMGIVGRTGQLKAIGLGLEHLLQSRDKPLMNCRTKRRDGTWRQVNWSNSRSVGARVAPFLSPLFHEVDEVWQTASSVAPSENGTSKVVSDGLAVFPSLLRGRTTGE